MVVEITKSSITCFNTVMETPLFYDLQFARAVYFSSRAVNKDTANEDALAVIPVGNNSVVLVISDGMGGLPAGEEASHTVINCMIDSIHRIGPEGIGVREAILDGFEAANNEILDMKNGSGATLVVAEIQDDFLRTYHAGDSMIMLVGNKGKTKYSVIAHSPTGYALESGMIDKAEAMMHEERHLVSNYIGSPHMRVEVGPNIRMSPRDTLILASDGLSDNLYDDEIAELSRRGDIISCTTKLVSECLNFMNKPVKDRQCHPDDLSVILFRLHK